MNTPLLLIHFNRPDITQRALAALKPLAPSQVWILCDAAREHRPEEASKVAEVRAQLDALPWPCEVRRLYREDNLGCFRNISDGISWFLKDCSGEGIILEDDCIPDPSFFRFCSELLERYRDAPSVMAISGHTGRMTPFDLNESYALSQYFGCWGWATWQSAWEQFDPDLTGWTERRQWRSICTRVLPTRWARIYWHLMFKRVADGRRDSWAYRYLLSIWKAKGTVVFPKWNLVRNIGSGTEATHAGQADQAELPIETIPFPLQHPISVSANKTIDQFFEGHVHSKSLQVRMRWVRRKVLSRTSSNLMMKKRHEFQPFQTALYTNLLFPIKELYRNMIRYADYFRYSKNSRVFIHIGKCGGSTVQEIFKTHRKNEELHIVHTRKPVYRSDLKYVVVVRNPISRIISAFNYAHKIWFNHANEAEKLKYIGIETSTKDYGDLNNLSEKLYDKTGRPNRAAHKVLSSIHHVDKGIEYYLSGILGKCHPSQIEVILTQETLSKDIKAFFGTNSTTHARRNSNYNEHGELSALATENLKKFLKHDYKIVELLFEFGKLDFETFELLKR